MRLQSDQAPEAEIRARTRETVCGETANPTAATESPAPSSYRSAHRHTRGVARAAARGEGRYDRCATPVIANAEMRVAADRTVLSVSVEPSIVSGVSWIPTSA